MLKKQLVEKNMREEKSPIKGQFPDKTKIKCKDCIHRDKTFVVINGNKILVGVTKSFCEIYKSPPDSNGKPHEVLFENAECEFYEKE